jgi:hypothetical protein
MAVDRKFLLTLPGGGKHRLITSSREEEEQHSENDSDDADSGSESCRCKSISEVNDKNRSFVDQKANSFVESRSSSVGDGGSDRLLVVSSKIKNGSIMQSAILQNIVFVQYKYETSSLDSCLG